MVERIQDLNLPISNVSRIIRDALPPNQNVDRETRIAIARATSVFIMYLSSTAAANAEKANHKIFTANDVFDAIEEMEFENFLGPMKQALAAHRQELKDKKDKRQSTDKGKANESFNASTASSKSVAAAAANTSDVIELLDDSDWGGQTELHPAFKYNSFFFILEYYVFFAPKYFECSRKKLWIISLIVNYYI